MTASTVKYPRRKNTSRCFSKSGRIYQVIHVGASLEAEEKVSQYQITSVLQTEEAATKMLRLDEERHWKVTSLLKLDHPRPLEELTTAHSHLDDDESDHDLTR